jgi:MTH538 TIR-like domain (DUF1863)
MPRRIFISYEGNDRDQAKGFNLLRWNTNVDLEFVGRHLLDPVASVDPDYVTRKIKEQLQGSSVTVVLLGEHTTESTWVAREVQWSLEKDNGILGIKLKGQGDAEVPQALLDCGAEIIDWAPDQFGEAIERAAQAAGRTAALARTGGSSGGSCAR